MALSETIRIMGEIDRVIDAHGGWPGAFVTEPTPDATGEGQTGPAPIGKARATPSPPDPPTSRPASTPLAPSGPVAPSNPVRDEERKSLLAALDGAGEALGMPLLSVKTKIDRRRLDEILPTLVREGILKQSGTGGSARYSRG